MKMFGVSRDAGPTQFEFLPRGLPLTQESTLMLKADDVRRDGTYLLLSQTPQLGLSLSDSPLFPQTIYIRSTPAGLGTTN